MQIAITGLLILLLAPSSGAGAEPKPAAWLEYEVAGSQVYDRISISLLEDGTANVEVARHDNRPPIAYSTALAPAEMSWFLTLVRTISFSNPNRFEGVLAGGHGGIVTVRARFDGNDLQARFSRDDAFDDLSRLVGRLVSQAEVSRALESDHHPYDLLSALKNHTVLQPAAFVQPLVTHIMQQEEQVGDALKALALVEGPEYWGGVLAAALEQASDKPLREGSTFSRRQLLLNVITNHPVYSDLPATHRDALIRIYTMQAAIEATKPGREAKENVRILQETEQRIRALK